MLEQAHTIEHLHSQLASQGSSVDNDPFPPGPAPSELLLRDYREYLLDQAHTIQHLHSQLQAMQRVNRTSAQEAQMEVSL